MQNVSSSNKLNTLGYEEKEIVMNSERLYVLWNFYHFPGRRRGERREEHREKLSLALKILILCSSCLQNAAASYSQPFFHRPAVFHSFPPSLLLFQPWYTRTRMDNSRKEKSNLIGNRIEVYRKEGSKFPSF